MKKYVIIAGVNGAGKSTFYSLVPKFTEYKKINLDDVVREIGDWKNTADVIKAGKIIVSQINECMESGKSFCQETTLCGKSILKTIDQAKELGYVIEMHYVGVDSADIAKTRVAQRVKAGGHGINESDIERRYEESFNNFKIVIDKCDLVAMYDNTESFRRFAFYRKGKLARLSSKVPEWFSLIR